MKMDVSKMTRLLTSAFETKLARTLRHQVFETLKGNNLLEGNMDCFGAGFYAEDPCRFVSQIGVEAD